MGTGWRRALCTSVRRDDNGGSSSSSKRRPPGRDAAAPATPRSPAPSRRDGGPRALPSRRPPPRSALCPRRIGLALRPPPHQAQPKVAFLFLTNSDLVFAPLWEKFFVGHHGLLNLYVHADPSAVLTIPPTPSFHGRIIRGNKATARAFATLISDARRLLTTALLDDPANQLFVLLSQSCELLHSFPTLYRALVTDKNADAGRHRHRSFIEILDNESTMPARYRARGDDVTLLEVPYGRFRVGSQFFVLARRHAVMVVRDRRVWNKFKAPCLVKEKDLCYPEIADSVILRDYAT